MHWLPRSILVNPEEAKGGEEVANRRVDYHSLTQRR